MEKVYKHKKTGQIAYYKDGVFNQNNCSVEIGVEPSSEFWTELTYEILSFRSHRNRFYNPTIQKDGTYLDAEIMEFDGNGASLEWMLNEDEYYITSVKRLSDGETFSIKDKITYKLANREVKTIVGIVLRNGNVWLKTDSERDIYGMDLEYSEKVKEPILVTEDNIELFGGESIFSVSDDFQLCYTSIATKENMQGIRAFSKKENAEEYILMNKPCLSLNDLLSVWGSNKDVDFYKESPMFQNFKNLAKTKL